MLDKPIVVDLDGTLVHIDTLHEAAIRTLRDKPWRLIRIPLVLSRGKSVLKAYLAQGQDFDAAHLPYNNELLAWLMQQRAAGRKIILCTAADKSIAEAVAAHLGMFDEIISSDGAINLAGHRKAAALEERYGRQGFDYAGNSRMDLAVWRNAHRAIVVNGARGLHDKAAELCEVEMNLPARPKGFDTWRRVFRFHQWLKNLLLLVPFIAAHRSPSWESLSALALAFLAFSICASSVYIANDLFDLESDRRHPTKRTRPFASGMVPVWMGVLLAPALLLGSVVIAGIVGEPFMLWLGVYFVVTCAYSWLLKRLVLVDCLTLAILYTLRIVAGAAALRMTLSFWLLAFSVFLFLSLAFVKRYAEIQLQGLLGKGKVHGRGYLQTDASIVQTMGITSGYAAVVVLALYLNSVDVLALYRKPEVIWLAVPVTLFWVSWVWLKAHRGQMHDDPVIFAIKDRISLVAGACFAIILLLGTISW